MKITEALLKVKSNLAEIEDLRKKITTYCAHLSHETPMYGDKTADKVQEWLQGANQLSLDNIDLLVRIQKTNLKTMVTIKIGDKLITKPISEWIWRKREYAKLDLNVWSALTDKGLREGLGTDSQGQKIDVKIVRNYRPELRDQKITEYKAESNKGGLIDAALSVANATTDLVED